MTFAGDKRDSVEEVFLTHLDMEFPELSHIAAAVKGDVSLSTCVAVSLNLSVITTASPYTDKQKKSSGEAVGAVLSLNYRKASSSFCLFLFRIPIMDT